MPMSNSVRDLDRGLPWVILSYNEASAIREAFGLLQPVSGPVLTRALGVIDNQLGYCDEHGMNRDRNDLKLEAVARDCTDRRHPTTPHEHHYEYTSGA